MTGSSQASVYLPTITAESREGVSRQGKPDETRSLSGVLAEKFIRIIPQEAQIWGWKRDPVLSRPLFPPLFAETLVCARACLCVFCVCLWLCAWLCASARVCVLCVYVRVCECVCVHVSLCVAACVPGAVSVTEQSGRSVFTTRG